MAAASIFISYRRDDSAGQAGRLFDRLIDHFGEDRVFRDVDDIAAGEDFVQAVQDKIAACEILIVVIGSRWLSVTDAAGKPRLAEPNDLVRREVAGALARDIRVVPVLVQDATMPAAAALPEDLRPLARRNAVELRDSKFDSDALLLIRQLDPKGFAFWGRVPWIAVGLIGALLLIAGGAGWWAYQRSIAPERARARLEAMAVPYNVEAFVQAAQDGRDKEVRLFLESGMDPNAVDSQHDTALGWAVQNGNLSMVRELLDAGADPGQVLGLAIAYGQERIFDFLLAQQPGREALDGALVPAAREESTYALKALLKAGADAASHESAALFEAAQSARPEAARLLIAAGANPRQERDDHWSVLHEAARARAADEANIARSVEMLRLLLDAGADINLHRTRPQEPVPTALYCALTAGNSAGARLLIERGANISLRAGQGSTTLMLAAEKGMKEVASMLLDRGVEVDAKAESGGTALIEAVKAFKLELMDLLIARGADVEASEYRRTPLWIAANHLHEEGVARLLAAGAQVDARGSRDRTPLMEVAVRFYEPETTTLNSALAIIKALLAAGASLSAEDEDGNSALDLAMAANSESKAVVRALGGS